MPRTIFLFISLLATVSANPIVVAVFDNTLKTSNLTDITAVDATIASTSDTTDSSDTVVTGSSSALLSTISEIETSSISIYDETIVTDQPSTVSSVVETASVQPSSPSSTDVQPEPPSIIVEIASTTIVTELDSTLSNKNTDISPNSTVQVTTAEATPISAIQHNTTEATSTSTIQVTTTEADPAVVPTISEPNTIPPVIIPTVDKNIGEKTKVEKAVIKKVNSRPATKILVEPASPLEPSFFDTHPIDNIEIPHVEPPVNEPSKVHIVDQIPNETAQINIDNTLDLDITKGQWGEYGAWSKCTATCGMHGTQRRIRSCNSGVCS